MYKYDVCGLETPQYVPVAAELIFTTSLHLLQVLDTIGSEIAANDKSEF